MKKYKMIPALILIFSLLILPSAAKAGAGTERWEPFGPPGGDRFRVFIHPKDNKILYCVGHGGVHKSTDAAENWKAVHTPEMAGSFLSFAFHPDDPEHIFTASVVSGIFESADGGATWKAVNEGFPGRAGFRYAPVSALCFDREKNLYAATVCGRVRVADVKVTFVYRFDRAKKRWEPFDAGLPDLKYETIGPAFAKLIDFPFVTALMENQAGGGLLLSLHGHGCFRLEGAKWVAIGPEKAQVTYLQPSPADPAEIYAGTRADWIYRTTDGGATWRRLDLPAKLSGRRTLPLVYNMAVDPNDPALVLIGCSAAGGSNEQPLFTPSPGQKAPAGIIVYRSDKNVYWPVVFNDGVHYCGFRTTIDGDGGAFDDPLFGRRSRIIYHTSGGLGCVQKYDGRERRIKVRGINGVYLNAMFVDERGIFLGAGEEGILLKKPGDADFRFFKSADTLIYTWCFARDYSAGDGYFYGTGHPAWSWPRSRGIYKMKFTEARSIADLGAMRSPEGEAAKFKPEQILKDTGIWTIKTFRSDPSLVYAGSQDRGFLVSRDAGGTFKELNEGLAEKNVCAILAGGSGEILFAGTRTSDGDILAKNPWHPMPGEAGGLYSFDERNKKWIPAGVKCAVYSIARSGGTIMCASSNGIFASADSGATWKKCTGGLPDKGLCVDVKCARGPKPVFYAGISGAGVFRSADGGASWKDISGDLTNRMIDELLVDPNDEKVVYAATLGGSAYRFIDRE